MKLRRQVFILFGMIAAALISALALMRAIQSPPVKDLGTGGALELAMGWLAIPALSLLIGVAATANRRFFVTDAIDGDNPAGNRAFDVNLRYNRNTLEQAVLAAFAWLGLAATAPRQAAALLPVLAALFGVGRATFWIGYLYAPWARAFGFGLTFYPTAAILVWLVMRLPLMAATP